MFCTWKTHQKNKIIFTCISIWKPFNFWNHFVAVWNLFENKCYKMEIIINACVEAFRVKVPLCNYARFVRRHNCLLASVAKFWSHLCTGVFDPGRSGVWIVWRCFEFFLVVLSFLTISFTMFLLVTQGLLMIRCVMICFINPVWVITK